MQFHIGDTVVHPAHGVGQVVKLEERRFGEEARLYYEVLTEKLTVWVPVGGNRGLGLRPLTKKGELSRYRKILKSRPQELEEDHRSRNASITNSLKEGQFQVVCEIVRDLTARGWNKSLTESDGNALRKAHDILCQEWAAASGLPLSAATQEVDAILNEAKLRYAPDPDAG